MLPTRLDGPILLQATAFGDERGFFLESYRRSAFAEIGIEDEFVQDNNSRSRRGIVRGMHYQPGMAKLVRCVRGAILDVVVDVRVGSPQFGSGRGSSSTTRTTARYTAPTASGTGSASCPSSPTSLTRARTTGTRRPRGVSLDDPEVGIEWPAGLEPTASAKDTAAPTLAELAPRLPFRYTAAAA